MWIAETLVDDFKSQMQLQKIVGTTAVRNLDHFKSTCELKRMYVSTDFRRLVLGQKLLERAIDYAINSGYSRMVLDSSRTLYAARTLYLKKVLLISLDTIITVELMCLWKRSYHHIDMMNSVPHDLKARRV